MNKRKKKKRAKLIIFFIILLFCVILYFCLFRKIITVTTKNNYVSKIANYEYTLEKRDSKLYKENFNELKSLLEGNEFEQSNYAEKVAKLFIIDFYTLSNKKTRYDIGGTEFIYPDGVGSFKLKAQDTIYNYIGRNLSLPEVISIEVKNIEETTYNYNLEEKTAFLIELSWEYKKDYGYDKNGKVMLASFDNILYVVEYTPEVTKWKSY